MQPVSAEAPAASRFPSSFWFLTLGSIGVVYGDIGTSPLYAFREAIKAASNGGASGPAEIYGVISLILWALTIICTIKYVLFLLRADNKGEGGILSLMALAQRAIHKKFGIVFLMGMAGAALFYGDACITPAISVLSAMEGMDLVTHSFARFVLPCTLAILVLLFMMQKHGTQAVSNLFGPIMVAWFLSIGLLGAAQIAADPAIITSINPYYGLRLLLTHQDIGLAVLGAVFLSVTGAEALYADLGHFGKAPIRTAWLWLVFPCLLLNYLGQGAFLLHHADGIENPFFLMAPHWSLLPLVLLANVATIIASQAVITGAFSLSRQAVQLGMLPRLEIRHTSQAQEGQIYMPKINLLLLYGVLFLCVTFRSSSALASAYGIAVTGTMIVTSCLAYIVVRHGWKRNRPLSLAMVAPFIVIEAVFLYANLQKLFDGGFMPLFLAAALLLLMTTWVRGTRFLYKQAHRTAVLLSDLTEMLDRDKPKLVPGSAIFMTSDPMHTPVALLQNLRHNKILHARNVILTVVTTQAPTVADDQRFIIERLSSAFTRVIIIFGYAETPDVPRALRILMARENLDIDLRDASYFLGRRSIVSSHTHRLQEKLARAWHAKAQPHKYGLIHRASRPLVLSRLGMPEWQDHIFIALANAAVAATDFYRIPRNQVVEMGTQLSV